MDQDELCGNCMNVYDQFKLTNINDIYKNFYKKIMKNIDS